jgi:hypothetical protein
VLRPGGLNGVALFAGDLAEPLLRIDDYPTGVRPIAADLGPLHDVLRRIDAGGVPFHLGVVPALLNAEMRRTLRGFKHVVPVVHGYDHSYPEKSALLIERHDRENARGTVGAFNEFAGQPLSEIRRKLGAARSILEDAFGRPVSGYIPPCNRADRLTGEVLVDLGYTHYFSERRIRGCALPHFASSFYGRSSDLRREHLRGVLTLHATWEADRLRQGDRTSLDEFLKRWIAERSASDAKLTGELKDQHQAG